MLAESEIKTHRLWHKFFFFTKKLGTIQQRLESQGRWVLVVRQVRFCSICRTDFYDGGEIYQAALDQLKMLERAQSSAAPANIIKLVPPTEP